jgi:endonuclease G
MFYVSFSQKLRDSVYIKSDIFEIMYSEVLEQPLWVKYKVQCPNGSYPRKGMDFYVIDSIKTSDNKDYEDNVYDKGHMAPAADFNCTKEMLLKTFTYLNCTLQNQYLNRGAWRLLEAYERELSKNFEVSVEINCEFLPSSIKLPTGATIPTSYTKTIKYSNKKEVYKFKNEKPISNNFKLFLIN